MTSQQYYREMLEELILEFERENITFEELRSKANKIMAVGDRETQSLATTCVVEAWMNPQWSQFDYFYSNGEKVPTYV